MHSLRRSQFSLYTCTDGLPCRSSYLRARGVRKKNLIQERQNEKRMNKGCMDRLYSHIDLGRRRKYQGLLFSGIFFAIKLTIELVIW